MLKALLIVVILIGIAFEVMAPAFTTYMYSGTWCFYSIQCEKPQPSEK